MLVSANYYHSLYLLSYKCQIFNESSKISNKKRLYVNSWGKSTKMKQIRQTSDSIMLSLVFAFFVAAVAPVSATVYFADGSEQNITFNGTYWYFDNFHGSTEDFYDDNY